jgi:uncharacterized protein YbaR (Trm112 family)
MLMDKKLLDILCCPRNKQSLSLMTKADLVLLNVAITAGNICQADGQALSHTINAGLLSQDRKWIYRVDDGIPVLLTEEAISSAQIANFLHNV